jgi:hypothetical protein
MTRFSDHLWSDLAEEHGGTLAVIDRPGAGRARLLRRPRLVAASTLGLAGAGTALLLTLGATSAPAYAVTTNGDGSVLVTINQLSALPQANAKLTAMGIDEQVTIYVASGAATVSGPVACAPDGSGPPLKVLLGKDGTQVTSSGQNGGNTGVGTFHMARCVAAVDTGAGNTGNTGAG